MRGQQLGLDVVEIGGGDDRLGAQLEHLAVGRAELDAAGDGAPARRPARGRSAAVGGSRTAILAGLLREDARDAGAGVQASAVLRGEPCDHVDQLREASLRVQHSAREVQGAHQVVHARGAVGGGAEEDGGIAQHLSQARILESARDEAVQGLREQPQQLRGPGQHRPVQQGPRRGVRGVEEALQGHVVGARGGVEIAGKSQPRTGLDPLEQVRIAGRRGTQVQRLLVPLAQDPVGRIERTQVELLLGGGAQQAQEVVEHLGHQVPRRSGVEAEPVALPAAGPAAQLLPRLDQVHLVAVPGQQRRGRQSRDAAADDHDRRAVPGAAHRRGPSTAARARIRAFSGAGTRTRALRMRAAGVRRSRRESAV